MGNVNDNIFFVDPNYPSSEIEQNESNKNIENNQNDDILSDTLEIDLSKINAGDDNEEI